MSISFVSHFKPKICSVQNVSPRRNSYATGIFDGLNVVEAIEVEGHSADAKSSKPDADTTGQAARKKWRDFD